MHTQIHELIPSHSEFISTFKTSLKLLVIRPLGIIAIKTGANKIFDIFRKTKETRCIFNQSYLHNYRTSIVLNAVMSDGGEFAVVVSATISG